MPTWRQLWGLDCPGAFGPTNWYVDLDQFAHGGFTIYFNLDGSCLRPFSSVAAPPVGAQIVPPGTPFFFNCQTCAGITPPPNFGHLCQVCGGGLKDTPYYIDHNQSPSNPIVLVDGMCLFVCEAVSELPPGAQLLTGPFFSSCAACAAAASGGWLRYVRCAGDQPFAYGPPPLVIDAPAEFYASPEDIDTCAGPVSEGHPIPSTVRYTGDPSGDTLACYSFAGQVLTLPPGALLRSGSSCFFLGFQPQELSSCGECLQLQDFLNPEDVIAPPGLQVINRRVAVNTKERKVSVKTCKDSEQKGCGDVLELGCPTSVLAAISDVVVGPKGGTLASQVEDHLPYSASATVGMVAPPPPQVSLSDFGYGGFDGVLQQVSTGPDIAHVDYCFKCTLQCGASQLGLQFTGGPTATVASSWTLTVALQVDILFTGGESKFPCAFTIDPSIGGILHRFTQTVTYRLVEPNLDQLPVLCPFGGRYDLVGVGEAAPGGPGSLYETIGGVIWPPSVNLG